MSTAAPPRSAVRPGPSRRPAPAPVAAGPSIDPFRVLRRSMLLIIASVFVGGAVGVAGFFLAAREIPRFDEKVVFKVQPVLAQANDVSNSSPRAEEVAMVAMTELQLAVDRETIKSAMRSADVKKTAWWRASYGESESIDEAADELIDELEVGVIPETELFMIQWGDRSKESVPVVLNSIASAYLARSEEQRQAKYKKNLDRFNDQKDESSQKISDKQTEIQDFIQNNGIRTLDDPRYNEVMKALTDLTSQAQSVDGQLASLRSSLSALRSKLDGVLSYSEEDLQQADTDPSVSAQIQRVQNLRTELEIARSRYRGEDGPQIRDLRNRLDAANDILEDRRTEVIVRNLRAAARNTENELSRLQDVQDSLGAELEAKEKRQTELSRQFAQFASLQAELEALREQEITEMRSIKEIELMQAREDAARATLYMLAKTPRERAFPKLPIMVPLGVLLVSGLTTGLVFLRALTDKRVRTAADVDLLPGAVVLGVVPEASEDPTRCREPELATWSAPTSVMAESYRQVTNVLLKEMSLADLRTLVLAGGMPKAGTTTLVSNLGASAAAAGRNVVVVDANFRRPRLAAVMGGDDSAPGLGDLLTGAADVDAVVHEHESGCAYIGAGSPEHRIVERLGTDALARAVGLLGARYDLIIFDAAPAVVAGDALAMAGRLDAAALVVRAGEEERGLVGRLVRQFGAATRLAGVVLNRPRGTAGGYFRKNFAVMANYAARD